MKKISLVLCSLFLMISSLVFADSAALPDENAAKEASSKIMAKIAEGDLDTAFKMIKPSGFFTEKEIYKLAGKCKAQEKKQVDREGAPIGYEFIDSKKVGESLVRFRYIEKTEKTALLWSFYFYKTKEG